MLAVSGAPLIKFPISVCTKAVVAICVVFVPAVAVGALGVPVNVGLAKGAFAFNAVWVAVEIGLFASLVLSTFPNPTCAFVTPWGLDLLEVWELRFVAKVFSALVALVTSLSIEVALFSSAFFAREISLFKLVVNVLSTVFARSVSTAIFLSVLSSDFPS